MFIRRLSHGAFSFVLAFLGGASSLQAATLDLASKPLFISTNVAPLNMLVMGRDHKMFYEAYNDASDINGDSIIDVGYQGWQGKSGTASLNVDYYGYFNSYACYDYSLADKKFVPMYVKSAADIAAKDKTCNTVAGSWSGDYLNYITTARIDALRKVLYGGYRSAVTGGDTATSTILERTHIPLDAHSWGKEYTDVATNGYNISHYTSLPLPAATRRHLIANVTLTDGGMPFMRVLNDSKFRIWEWVSKERPVAESKCINNSTNCVSGTSVITDYVVKVDVCKTGIPTDTGTAISDDNCQVYSNGTSYKPIGILHEFGENNSMLFGLLTGSYEKNLDGGVLRKQVSSFTDEVNPVNGRFTGVNGIVKTINAMKTVGFQYSDQSYANNYTVKWDSDTQSKKFLCGWVTGGPITNGQCSMWGNPVAEMMYESLRYFAGKGSATSDFAIGATNTVDSLLGLPLATWNDPYNTTTGGANYCAKPFQIVISDINPSYDSDRLPGSYFNSSFTGDISGLNVTTLGDKITANESDVTGKKYIGQSGTDADNNPTPKTVNSLGNIRGISPEEPTKLGSYYSASMAYHGFLNDISSAKGKQQLQTFSVALASPLPKIEIPIPGGKTVTVVPFAKSPGSNANDIDYAKGKFQPTNQIVDFYVESLTATSGSFLINYEDVEQGADHDMDAIARYTYQLNANNTVTIKVDSVYSAGGIDQHMGYVISGTTADGIYLVVRDIDNTTPNVYYLDTPADRATPSDPRGTTKLGTASTRTFTPGSTSGAGFLKDPLWYAAKYGGFTDANENDLPDVGEWDTSGDGNPDNYFLVTNALKLSEQLRSAFNQILAKSGSSASVAVNSGSLSTDTLLFQALFNSDDWSGQLKALPLNADGTLGAPDWQGEEVLQAQVGASGGHLTNREVISINTATQTGVPFRWPAVYTAPDTATEISATQVGLLVDGITVDIQDYGNDLVAYLRGDQAEEKGVAGAARLFRTRDSLLGDIVSSDPLFIQAPAFFFPNTWPAGSPENNVAAKTYSQFRSDWKTRKPMLAFGANDGMVHIVNAYKKSVSSDAGREILAYVPGEIYGKLSSLASQDYTHDYFVDGKLTYSDAFFDTAGTWHTTLVGALGGGGQGIYALDVTDPTGSTATYKAFDEANADSLVLWEFTDEDHADLGYTYGRPAIARMANGRWAAVFANGYNNTKADGAASTSGNAVLYIVDIEDGTIMTKDAQPLDTLQGAAADPLEDGRPNGLASPVLADVNGDSIVDYIYAGDLFGNLWKFDVTDTNATNWDFAYKSGSDPAPLFVAKDAEGNRLPITTRPQISRHPEFTTGNNYMVFFGTGKYLEVADNDPANQNTQAFFGIWDDGINNGAALTDLLKQTITKEISVTIDGNAVPFRLTSDGEIKWKDTTDVNGDPIAKHRGWYLELQNTGATPIVNLGERQVSDSILRNDRLIFTTLIPNKDPCQYGGSGWIMELDPENGGTLDFTPFDVNNDGKFTIEDMVDSDGDGDPDTYVSGIGTGSGETGGFANQPVILDDGVKEKKYSSLSSGTMSIISENPANKTEMRHSWREVH